MSEPGPYGEYVGDPLMKLIKQKFPIAQGSAVQYPASLETDSLAKGVADIVGRLKSQTAKCPRQRFAFVGYSEGANVVHRAVNAGNWDKKFNKKLVAIALYGDPGAKTIQWDPTTHIPAIPKELEKKVLNNCAKGDPFCDDNGSMDNFGPHMSYNDTGATYHEDTVKFIARRFWGLHRK